MRKMMNGIRSNSGLTYALKYAASYLKQGIGMSKRWVYKELGGRSPFIHSYSTFNRYMGIAKEFVRDMKERGINRLDKVQYEHVREWLDRKAVYVTEKTLKVNTSALEKFFDAVGRSDISDRLRQDYQEIYSQGNPSGRALPFAEPMKVIESLKDPAHRIVAELQYLTGARVGDVKKIEVIGDKVVIESSKGGRDRVLDFSDRLDKLERIKELKAELDRFIQEKGWKDIRESYYDDLRETCKRLGEVYTGAHAFRVNYAIERFEELKATGLNDREADRVLTQELGHNREEMSRYYRSL